MREHEPLLKGYSSAGTEEPLADPTQADIVMAHEEAAPEVNAEPAADMAAAADAGVDQAGPSTWARPASGTSARFPSQHV